MKSTHFWGCGCILETEEILDVTLGTSRTVRTFKPCSVECSEEYERLIREHDAQLHAGEGI